MFEAASIHMLGAACKWPSGCNIKALTSRARLGPAALYTQHRTQRFMQPTTSCPAMVMTCLAQAHQNKARAHPAVTQSTGTRGAVSGTSRAPPGPPSPSSRSRAAASSITAASPPGGPTTCMPTGSRGGEPHRQRQRGHRRQRQCGCHQQPVDVVAEAHALHLLHPPAASRVRFVLGSTPRKPALFNASLAYERAGTDAVSTAISGKVTM